MRSYSTLKPGSRFGPIYRSGTRRRSGGITVLQAVGKNTKPELGVVAGKGVGNAVQRNRAKRRLREAAQVVSLRPNTAYVVVASPDVLDARFVDVTNWLESALVSGGNSRRKDAQGKDRH